MRHLSREAQWSIGSFIVIVGAVSALLMFLGRGGDMCGNDVWSESKSPDGKWKAVIFAVDCGATATNKELAPRISVVRADETLSDPDRGNIFGAGNNGRAMPPGAVQANWTAADELTIQYSSKVKVFKQETKYKDVTIKYVAEP